MATATHNKKKNLSTDPFKLSRPMGAALAMMGIEGAMPLLHGAQGCASFAKVLLTRHFREPIPMGTSALSEMPVILGGEENLKRALLKLSQKLRPSLIGVITTALSETRGEDLKLMLKSFKAEQPEFTIPLVVANVPDFQGSLEDGFAMMQEALVLELLPKDPPPKPLIKDRLVNILPGAGFGPGDVDEIKGLVEAFGLHPIVLPDISLGLDGRLSGGFSPIVKGGTRLDQIKNMPHAKMSFALGPSAERAARAVNERFLVPYVTLDSVTGLMDSDLFVRHLMEVSDSNKAPKTVQRDRERLLDVMLDAHFFTGGKRLSAALEPDELLAVTKIAKEVGMGFKALIAPADGPAIPRIDANEVAIGDLGDLENLAGGSDLIAACYRAQHIAKHLGVPFLRMGIPIFDHIHEPMRSKVGYNGSARLLADIANLLLEQEEHEIESRHLEDVNLREGQDEGCVC
jgi:nitrogenase molybdenum-iron protein NifN